MTRTLDEAQAAAVALIGEWEARTERLWSRVIKNLSKHAAERLPRFVTVVAAAGDPPGWQVPDPEEILPLDTAAEQARDATQAQRERYAYSVSAEIGTVAAIGVAFDVRNPLVEGVIAKHSGRNITRITETIRDELMTALQDAHEQGMSVPHAAAHMRKRGDELSKARALVIARTELNSINNGASHAAVQAVNQASAFHNVALIATHKTWLATSDARTRADHAHANGQAVKLNEDFSVGGYPMSYPGDPNGPAREVVNCRCTLTYGDAPALAASLGENMTPDPITAATATEEVESVVGGAWNALLAQEGVETGDGRKIEPNALKWRDLPLTLMAMTEDSAMGGHDGSAVAGRIDEVTRAGQNIDGTGVFDSGEYGVEIERLVRAQMLRGVSVDLAVDEWTLEPPEGYEDDPNYEPFWDDTFVILKGTILGATVCPFPAFADAKIIVASRSPFLVTLQMPFEPTFGAVTASGEVFDEASVEAREAVTQAIVDLLADHHPACSVEGTLTINGEPVTFGAASITASVETPARGQQIEGTYGPKAGALNRIARHLDGVCALAASAAPERPPLDWFTTPEPDRPTPITITEDGHIFGHAALWGTCHLGMPGCTTPPANQSGSYSWFHLGEVDTDGGLLSVGTITLDTGHADLRSNARTAIEHYDHTGTQAAYVRAIDGKYGIFIRGTIKPDVDMAVVRELRAAKLSGDWRPIGGNSEMVGLLAVNVPGFPVPREEALMASAADGTPRVLALVAAGIPNEARAAALLKLDEAHPNTSLAALRDRAHEASGRFTLEGLRRRAHA